VGEQPAPHLAGQAQRAERYERDVPRLALGEDVQGSLVGQIEQVLHAHDLGLGDRPQQLRPRDVAEADAVNQALLAGLDQHRELGVEPPARSL